MKTYSNNEMCFPKEEGLKCVAD